MRQIKFKKVKDGEWIQPQMRRHLLACCDCGLVHRMDFRVTEKGNVQLRAWRARNQTAARRKNIKDADRKILLKELSKTQRRGEERARALINKQKGEG